MAPKENNAISKIKASEKRWHNTFGEYFLRYAGIFLALIIIIIGLKHSSTSTLLAPGANTVQNTKYDTARNDKTLLFVSVNSDESYSNEVMVIKEAISSYHRVKIISQQGRYDAGLLQKENQVVFVMGSNKIDELDGLVKLMEKVAEKNIPLYWLGNGFPHVAHIFDIPLSDEEGLSLTPPKSSLTYNDTEIAASGLSFSRADLTDFANLGEVLASVTLHETFSRPALIQHGNIIYSAFNPFSRSNAPFALSVIMDSLSLQLGEHKPNPRIIFRLEDINGVSYREGDTSFIKTTNYLMEQGVFVHMGIIPTTVDANGEVLAEINAALPVLEFVNNNPDRVGIIQHGYKHWRKDPRNKGMGSGDGSEFFLDDDQTMGVEAAQAFANKVIKDGCAVMLESGLVPTMFEAPHYEISRSQQQVAENIFSLIQHPPLFFYSNGPYGFSLPWLTHRNKSVYVPNVSSDYVDMSNLDSLNDILYSLETARSILPDPVVLVYFHPFIKESKGGEGALEKLIEGIKALDYRFVNMLDEVEASSVRHCQSVSVEPL